ncbi:hypothetical protein N9P60_00275 [bacterium]|nr:hypothetical protein [bacterium]MDB4319864.1 hypothetical protein [bacterium]
MENFDFKKYLAEGKLLKENAPGYSTRKTGEALPTLESVKAAYEAKDNIKEYLEPNELEDLGYSHGEKYLMNDIDSSLFNQPYFEHYLSGFAKGLKDNSEASRDYMDSIDMEDENQSTINEELYDFVRDIKSAVGSNASLNNIEYYLGRDINDEERGALINAGVLRQVSDERYGSQYKKIQRRRY